MKFSSDIGIKKKIKHNQMHSYEYDVLLCKLSNDKFAVIVQDDVGVVTENVFDLFIDANSMYYRHIESPEKYLS